MSLAGKTDHYALIQNRRERERESRSERAFFSFPRPSEDALSITSTTWYTHRGAHTPLAQPYTALYRAGDFPHWESITNNLTFHWPLCLVPSSASRLYLHAGVTPDLELSARLALCSPGRFQGSVLVFGKVQIEPCGSKEQGAAISHDRSMVGLTTGQGASASHNLLIESQCQCWHDITGAAKG